MVATARSDLFDGLVRKIGYSVGLEFLSARVLELAQTFFAQRSLDGGDWRTLVQDSWNRKSPQAEQHIADVYSQLQLVRRHNKAVHVLPALEVLSILFSDPPDWLTGGEGGIGEDSHAKAVRFVLALKVLEADGDIFLNALASRFEPQQLGVRLKQMIRHKRRLVGPLFKQAASIRLMMAAVSIRNQTEAQGKPKRQTYAERSRAFMSGATVAEGVVPSEEWWDSEVFISEDYLEKACLTRGNWAEEFGLFTRSEGTLTELGGQLLREADRLGISFEHSDTTAYAFWPYVSDLSRMSLTPKLLGIRSLTSWDLTETLANVFLRATGPEFPGSEPADRDELAMALNAIHARYRAVNRRGTIRHDLPLYIAEPVVAYWFGNTRRAIPNIRDFVRAEGMRRDRFVDFVMIHGTEGGLRLMRAKDGNVK